MGGHHGREGCHSEPDPGCRVPREVLGSGEAIICCHKKLVALVTTNVSSACKDRHRAKLATANLRAQPDRDDTGAARGCLGDSPECLDVDPSPPWLRSPQLGTVPGLEFLEPPS
eukprot:GHVU01143372.1.p1 GENE.GHVU01143372.1~~GHVU01143372.1.p1  ORF type:complete len:114 (-),score=2.97 GHVU01143372.1:28-369(-)